MRAVNQRASKTRTSGLATRRQFDRKWMDLYLRNVVHPQAHDNYRVILKDDGLELEIGSIGIQHGSGGTEHWTWGIDAGDWNQRSG